MSILSIMISTYPHSFSCNYSGMVQLTSHDFYSATSTSSNDDASQGWAFLANCNMYLEQNIACWSLVQKIHRIKVSELLLLAKQINYFIHVWFLDSLVSVDGAGTSWKRTSDRQTRSWGVYDDHHVWEVVFTIIYKLYLMSLQHLFTNKKLSQRPDLKSG